MKILNFVLKLKSMLFGSHLELRIRLFNTLACAGIVSTLFAGITGIFIDAGIANLLINVVLLVVTVLLLRYAVTSRNYQLCYLITIIIVFCILFPAFFITAGGYRSGMPIFFVFAILFTVFMLEGTRMRFLVVALLFLYSSLIVFAYFFPERISHFETEADMMIDILTSFLIVSLVLGITMSLHLSGYIKQQNELVAARRQTEEYAKMKGALFTAMSHELRTPLAVMSAYAQFAVEQIRENGSDEQTLADLDTVSEEAKRLTQLADNTLRVFMAVTATDGAELPEIAPVNIGDMAKRLTQLFNPVAKRHNKILNTFIDDDIIDINGDAGELIQLMWNILHNALTHSNRNIELKVKSVDDMVTIMVKDDGEKIPQDILEKIFQWGVSGSDGGSGIGLSICYDITREHNGKIVIKNDEDGGVQVTVSLKGKTGGRRNG